MRASHSMRRLALLCLLALPLSLLAAGCGKEGTVSGKVYYKGELLKGGMVTFFPESAKAGDFRSPIGEDGSYSIPKVPPGSAKIAVMVGIPTPPPSIFKGRSAERAEKAYKSKMTSEEAKKAATPKDKDAPFNPLASGYTSPLPEKYSDPDKSGLTVNVTGGKMTHDIKMD